MRKSNKKDPEQILKFLQYLKQENEVFNITQAISKYNVHHLITMAILNKGIVEKLNLQGVRVPYTTNHRYLVYRWKHQENGPNIYTAKGIISEINRIIDENYQERTGKKRTFSLKQQNGEIIEKEMIKIEQEQEMLKQTDFSFMPSSSKKIEFLREIKLLKEKYSSSFIDIDINVRFRYTNEEIHQF